MTTATLAIAILRLAGQPIEPGPTEVRARLLAATILRAAEDNNVAPLILAALQQHETGGNPRKIGAKGERGRWQVLPKTARFLGFTGSDDALAADPLNAHFAAAWLAHVHAGCLAKGYPDDPLLWLNRYRGGPCRKSWYAQQIMDEVWRVSKQVAMPEAISDYYRKLDAEPRERTR